MAADIQLLALDIDGTIAGKSNQVNESVKKAIAAVQSRGIQVAIATGRMYCSALRFHQQILSNQPMIVYNGALIKDPTTSKTYQHCPISQEIARQVLQYFEQPQHIGVLSVNVYIEDRLYVRQITSQTQRYSDRTGIVPIPVGNLSQFLNTEPTKILALCQEPTVMDRLFVDLRQLYTPDLLYLTKSVDTFFEVTNPIANKGNALRYLAEELLDLQAENVMAVGDNFNDAEMLAYAGISVAMGDAPEGVKTLANWVAPTVEEDGAVAAIEKFLL